MLCSLVTVYCLLNMKGFPGFPDGKLKLTQIPNLFFSDLLPIIDDLGELKVKLYAFWALE